MEHGNLTRCVSLSKFHFQGPCRLIECFDNELIPFGVNERMKYQTGITRVEIITVAVILLISAGLLLPWIYNQRGRSQRTFCESRQMVIAKGLFVKSVDTPFFPGFREVQATLDNGVNVETSWVFPLLPYVHPLGTELAEEMKLKKAAELSQSESIDLYRTGPYAKLYSKFGPGGNLSGDKISDYVVELVCPASGKAPTADVRQPLSFVVNCGMPDVKSEKGPLDHRANGVFFDRVGGSTLMNLDFLLEHDGLETTLMLSENLDAGQSFDVDEHQVGFVWIDSFSGEVAERDNQRLLGINRPNPGPISMKSARPSSQHDGGVNVAFCDGSTTFLSEEIDYLALVHFMTSASDQVKVAGSNEWVKEPYRIPLGRE